MCTMTDVGWHEAMAPGLGMQEGGSTRRGRRDCSTGRLQWMIRIDWQHMDLKDLNCIITRSADLRSTAIGGHGWPWVAPGC